METSILGKRKSLAVDFGDVSPAPKRYRATISCCTTLPPLCCQEADSLRSARLHTLQYLEKWFPGAFFATDWSASDALKQFMANSFDVSFLRRDQLDDDKVLELLEHLLLRVCSTPVRALCAEQLQKETGSNKDNNDMKGNSSDDKNTLQEACDFLRSIIHRLCDLGVSPDARAHESLDGQPALHVAVKHRNQPAIAALMERGATVDLKDYKGERLSRKAQNRLASYAMFPFVSAVHLERLREPGSALDSHFIHSTIFDPHVLYHIADFMGCSRSIEQFN